MIWHAMGRGERGGRPWRDDEKPQRGERGKEIEGSEGVEEREGWISGGSEVEGR